MTNLCAWWDYRNCKSLHMSILFADVLTCFFYLLTQNTPWLATWVPRFSKTWPEGAKFRNTPSACCGDTDFEGFASLFDSFNSLRYPQVGGDLRLERSFQSQCWVGCTTIIRGQLFSTDIYYLRPIRIAWGSLLAPYEFVSSTQDVIS